MHFVRMLIIVALLAPARAVAHPGGTDANGCHTNHSTGNYHCHGGGGGEAAEDDTVIWIILGMSMLVAVGGYFLMSWMMSPSSGGGGETYSGGDCQSDDDCGRLTVCRGGMCRDECGGARGCSDDYECVDRACQPVPTSGSVRLTGGGAGDVGLGLQVTW